MIVVVSITDFRNNISNYINSVIYKKDEIVLKKGKSIVAKVIGYDREKEIEDRNKALIKLSGLWTKRMDVFYKKYKKAMIKKEKEDWKKLEKIFKTV